MSCARFKQPATILNIFPALNHIFVMSTGENTEVIQDQDRFLPIGEYDNLISRDQNNLANVARIMKRVVPPSGKLSKESKECVQECVTELIQFIVAEASERCTTVGSNTSLLISFLV